MTNCEKIRNAVRPFMGQNLGTGKIVSLVLSMYPATNPTSIIPSDHSGPNPRSGRSYCSCSRTGQIFNRNGNTYQVRSLSESDGTGSAAALSSSSPVPLGSPYKAFVPSADRTVLVDSLKRLGPVIRESSDLAWRRDIAVRVIDCILSLHRPYDSFVVPRLNQFERQQPRVRSITELQQHIGSFTSPAIFVTQDLNYYDDKRAMTLSNVVDWLVTISGRGDYSSQLSNLEEWATKAKPEDHLSLGIHGFALGGFQYLRMLFGANTTKPDIHIRRYVESCVGHRVSDTEALALLETAAKEADICLRNADTTIWERSARRSSIA